MHPYKYQATKLSVQIETNKSDAASFLWNQSQHSLYSKEVQQQMFLRFWHTLVIFCLSIILSSCQNKFTMFMF